MSLSARRKAFRALHERGCFPIPNPWDVGSARYVGGAPALAAWTGFMRAAQTLRSEGTFAGLAGLAPYAELNGRFATDLERPRG